MEASSIKRRRSLQRRNESSSWRLTAASRRICFCWATAFMEAMHVHVFRSGAVDLGLFGDCSRPAAHCGLVILDTSCDDTCHKTGAASAATVMVHDVLVVELHHEPTLFWCKHSVLLLVTLSHHRRCAADILHRAVRGEADLGRRNLRDQPQAGLPPQAEGSCAVGDHVGPEASEPRGRPSRALSGAPFWLNSSPQQAPPGDPPEPAPMSRDAWISVRWRIVSLRVHQRNTFG